MALIDEDKLSEKWHRVDERCRSLVDACPETAKAAIGEAAVRIGQAGEYTESQYFLRLASQNLYQAERLMPQEGD